MANSIWKFSDKSAAVNSITGQSVSTVNNSKDGYRNIIPFDGKRSLINIKDDFIWNINNVNGANSARANVPAIRVIEKKIKHNALYAQLSYGIGNFIESSQKALPLIAAKGAELAASAQTKEKSNATLNVLTDILGGVAKGTDNATSLNNTINASLKANGINITFGGEAKGEGALAPYSGLYLTDPTGFEYVFPYYSDTFMQGNLGRSGTANSSAVVSKITDIVNGQISIGFDSAGYNSLIEKAEDILPPDAGAKYQFTFYLFNTMEYADVVRNWQFIYLISYQNKIGRLNRSLIDLPVIYELQIPGGENIPYAMLSDLKVDFVGNRRMIDIIDAYSIDGNNQTINTIVPEAYKVSITFQSLIRDSKNILFAGLKQQSKINTNINRIAPSIDNNDTLRGRAISAGARIG